MTGPAGDPIEEWRAVSERAAGATGYRARTVVTARPAHGFGAGAALLVTVVLAGSLVLRPWAARDAGGDAPVVATTEDGTFRLTLMTPRNTYGPGDKIEPVATLTYLGPDPTTGISHSDPAVGFAIEEIGGPRVMSGFFQTVCQSTPLTKDRPITAPFEKRGTLDKGFDEAWYRDPVLSLPVGAWRIKAVLDVYIGDCGGEHHQLTVENTIRVSSGSTTSPAPSSRPTPTVSPSPSPTFSADAVAARELVRKYVDGLMTDHVDSSWNLLSDWSKRTVGSFATFADAERRLKAFDPESPTIMDPSRDPALLDPAFLGPRAADIAKTADPNRAFVVTLRRPQANGASAGSANLVVAPVGGLSRIWLDAAPVMYGARPYPDGCPAFAMTVRRCRAVVEQAAQSAGVDLAAASATWLMPDAGCGGDPTKELVLCTRSMALVAGVRFEFNGRDPVRQDVFCGVGLPSLVCSETPSIQAIDMHNGYWDVPCPGEPPDGCPSPIAPPTGAAADGARELRLGAIDLPVGEVGHHEIEVGMAVLPGGVLSEGRMSIDQTQEGFLLDPGSVTMVIRSTGASRPPFDNIYQRGVSDQPETVRVVLVFDVVETSPSATIHVTDLLVR